MGIYINGVEMPKSCGHCFMNHICERIPTQKAMFVTKRLKGCPIVQAREPKRGEWIPHKEDNGKTVLWKCSECGQIIYSETETDRLEFHKWCSRCGADMRGKGDE